MGLWSLAFTLMKIVLFLFASVSIKLREIFPMDVRYECQNPPLQANHSGIKLMVAGLAKSGTTATCWALNDLGVRTYHSGDWRHFFWAPLFYGDEWSHLPQKERRQLPVINAMPSEELAGRLSRCRPDGVAFDGLEALMPKVWSVSPGAKVLMLNWRSYESWLRSTGVFYQKLWYSIQFNRFLCSSPNVLPIWRPLFHGLDRLLGGPVRRVSEEGGPPQSFDISPMMFFYLFATGNRYQTRFLFGDDMLEAMMHPSTEEEYNKYYQDIKDKVPPEDLLEYNPKTMGYEELCSFLDIAPCPRSGQTKNINIAFRLPSEFPKSYACVLAVCFAMHVVNYYIVKGIFSMLLKLLTSVTGASAGMSSKKKA